LRSQIELMMLQVELSDRPRAAAAMEIAHQLERSTGWPSRKPIVLYHGFAYQA
jgi:hypothetical protein